MNWLKLVSKTEFVLILFDIGQGCKDNRVFFSGFLGKKRHKTEPNLTKPVTKWRVNNSNVKEKHKTKNKPNKQIEHWCQGCQQLDSFQIDYI